MANQAGRRALMQTTEVREQAAAGAHRDLREWLERVRAIGQLQEVRGAEWNLEIGILAELNAKRADSKCLLFDDVTGYPKGYRVVAGALLNAPRLALALNLAPTLDDQGLVQALRGEPRRWETEAAQYQAVAVPTGPLFENTREGAAV